MFHHLAHLLSQFCQFPIRPGRTRQRVEQPKSKSTQPRFARRWAALYFHATKRSFFVRRPPKNAPRDYYTTDSGAMTDSKFVPSNGSSSSSSVPARRRRILLLRPQKATALRYPSTNLRANRLWTRREAKRTNESARGPSSCSAMQSRRCRQQ